MQTSGKVSWFGGPDDTGVSPSEGLAFIYDVDMAPHLFLESQPPGTTGLARRLDPEMFFIACRWDYDQPDTSKTELLKHMAKVRSPKTGKEFLCYPADWGPNANTGRVADISKGLMEALGITTDDTVEVTYPAAEQEERPMTYESIVISSGHSTKCQGAIGVLNEVAEATRVVDEVTRRLRDRGVNAISFHDTVSTSSNENLNRIVNFHNSKQRDLDVSVHFNAHHTTDDPMGCEVLYVSQADLADRMSAAIAESGGFKDRGPKKRTDLFFLNSTEEPSILLEVCFVDSTHDADLYEEQFEAICESIATVLGGAATDVEQPEPGPEPEPVPPAELPRVDITVTGEVLIYVNGEQVGTKGRSTRGRKPRRRSS